MKAQYLTCCVHSDAESIIDMVDRARQITWQTFARRVRWREWAASMGYGRTGLHPRDDYAVSFHKSIFRGQPCYYVEHSRIEFVFTVPHSNGLPGVQDSLAHRDSLN